MSYWVVERKPRVGNRRYARLSYGAYGVMHLWQENIHQATKFLRRRDAEGLVMHGAFGTFVAEHEDVEKSGDPFGGLPPPTGMFDGLPESDVETA